MSEYNEYDVVYYSNETPQIGGNHNRKPSRYEMDAMTPSEIDAYVKYDEYRYQDY